MNGKQKCNLLRKIREEIAEVNGIVYLSKDCGHEVCRLGTCQICDAEAKYLENELNEKINRGERINIRNLSLDTYLESLEIEDNYNDEYDDDYPIMGDCDVIRFK